MTNLILTLLIPIILLIICFYYFYKNYNKIESLNQKELYNMYYNFHFCIFFISIILLILINIFLNNEILVQAYAVIGVLIPYTVTSLTYKSNYLRKKNNNN